MLIVFVFALISLIASGVLLAGWTARALGVRSVLAGPRRLRVSGDLGSRVGTHVALEGELVGGQLETRWPTATLPGGPHPATPSVDASGLALEIEGGVRVALLGPAQVVVGHEELRVATEAGHVLARRVPPGARVLVDGQVARTADEEGASGYRVGAVALALVPHRTEGWPGRPLAVYGTSPRTPGHVVAAAVCLTLGLGASVALVRAESRPPPPRGTERAVRPACSHAVLDALAGGDPWRAEALADRCGDLEARGHVAWTLGKVDAAADAFLAARKGGASFAPTTAEAESLMLARPEEAPSVLRALRNHGYDAATSADVIGCLADRLLPRVAGKGEEPARGATGADCVASEHREASARRAFHFLPAWSLDDSGRYQRIRFLFGRDVAWRDEPCLPGTSDPSTFCGAHEDAQRALFAAWTDDRALFRSAVFALEAPLAALSREERRDAYGGGGERLVLSQAMAVAANAAWAIGDDETMRRFAVHGEAHARAILEEQLALEAGTQVAPAASHAPSDYSAIDVEMLRVAREESAGEVVRRLAEARFTNPARLAVIVAPPSRREVRARVAAWAASGFVPPALGSGFFEVVRAHYERRVVARKTGEQDLERRLGEVGRRFSAAAQRPGRFVGVVGLESLGVR